MVIRTIKDRANCDRGRGIRYDAEWLLECLLLRIKSPKAYKHLRERNLLPLPCSTTVRRLLSSMQCSYGFNEEALASIKRTLESLSLDLKRGSLVWDEMSISKAVKYDPQKMKFEGFSDYGYDDINADPKAACDQLADHCLVFIFRPYRASWIQPIAVFATKGAAPGHIISNLVLALHPLPVTERRPINRPGRIAGSTELGMRKVPSRALWSILLRRNQEKGSGFFRTSHTSISASGITYTHAGSWLKLRESLRSRRSLYLLNSVCLSPNPLKTYTTLNESR